MVEVVNGEINLEKIEVSDIIDVRVLQNFLDNFALGMNCAAVSVDRSGAEITNPSYYREFCNNYIHSSSLGDSRCAECHNRWGEEAVRQGKPYVARCHSGMIDFAAPIMVRGIHIGTVLGGQILDREPEKESVYQVADGLGLDRDELWQAAGKIDIVQMKSINAAAEVLYIVVNSLAENGYNRLEIEVLSNRMTENFMQISETINHLSESAQHITDSQNELSNKIAEVDKTTTEITNVLNDISAIASKTKIIGLNASIEAARIGVEGRSFAVVAEEIQKLAGKSAGTVRKGNELNLNINEKIQSTVSDGNSIVEITSEQSAAMEELTATVQETVEMANRLHELFADK